MRDPDVLADRQNKANSGERSSPLRRQGSSRSSKCEVPMSEAQSQCLRCLDSRLRGNDRVVSSGPASSGVEAVCRTKQSQFAGSGIWC
jgi:hypothetical protein